MSSRAARFTRLCVMWAVVGARSAEPQSAPARQAADSRGSVLAVGGSVTLLRQRDPDEGAEASEHTVVLVRRDGGALIISVHAYDKNPDAILASQLRRDADLSSDDNIPLLIDSHYGRRSAFLFSTNVYGAMWDAQLSGSQVNADWNGIWDVKTRRDDSGWYAEFHIPLQTLRFSSRDDGTFGFNVRRVIRRKNEEALWRGWRRAEG